MSLNVRTQSSVSCARKCQDPAVAFWTYDEARSKPIATYEYAGALTETRPLSAFSPSGQCQIPKPVEETTSATRHSGGIRRDITITNMIGCVDDRVTSFGCCPRSWSRNAYYAGGACPKGYEILTSHPSGQSRSIAYIISKSSTAWPCCPILSHEDFNEYIEATIVTEGPFRMTLGTQSPDDFELPLCSYSIILEFTRTNFSSDDGVTEAFTRKFLGNPLYVFAKPIDEEALSTTSDSTTSTTQTTALPGPSITSGSPASTDTTSPESKGNVNGENKSSKKSGLPTATAVGIGVGVGVPVISIAIFAVYWFKRRGYKPIGGPGVPGKQTGGVEMGAEPGITEDIVGGIHDGNGNAGPKISRLK
ncbi:hypothetical protein TWF281_005788 [Arthrobotrys megalospora]